MVEAFALAAAAALAVGSVASAQSESFCSMALSQIESDPISAIDLISSAPSPDWECAGGESEANLLAAYAYYKSSGSSREFDALRGAVRDYDKSGAGPSRVLGLALIEVATRQLAEGNERALRTAERAEDVLVASAPEDDGARARAILAQSAATLIKQPNFASDLIEAFDRASRARSLFGDATAASSSDHLEAVAWQAAILGVIAGNRRAKIDEAAASSALAVAPASCDAAWDRSALSSANRRVSWSGSMMSGGGFLGVVAVVDAAEDGTAVLARIAGEARLPSIDPVHEAKLRSRDKAVRNALKRWRLSDGAAAECRSGVLAPLGVYIRESGGAGAILNDWPLNYTPSE